MKILILEDNESKFDAITEVVKEEVPNGDIEWVKNLRDYTRIVNSNTYDLIIIDLLIPRYPDEQEIDCTDDIINELTHDNSRNLYTTTIALTQFSDLAQENFTPLNAKDIIIVKYDPDSDEWKKFLKNKIKKSKPKKKYAFIIICALKEEADAFKNLELNIGILQNISGMLCEEIVIKEQAGLIIRCARMGLVSAAITATKAIELFEPQVISMSGICAGVKGRAKIYDVIISEMCHQHDSGKWTEQGFVQEPYSVQLDHELKQNIMQIIENSSFIESIKNNVSYDSSELPLGHSELKLNIHLGVSSSGSSVLADQQKSEELSQQHRKLSIFEMESYAIYESARVAFCKPRCFSVKCVVDNGDSDKGDKYHRVACLLSAKTVVGILQDIL